MPNTAARARFISTERVLPYLPWFCRVFCVDARCGDDGLEGENPERARECIFARKRFPATLSGICGGNDELERADSERARKQIRMRKRFPETSSRGDDELEHADSERARECIFARKRFPSSRNAKGPGACAGAFEVEGMTGIEPA